jgi:excisionase family DNA binding protein
MQVAVVSAEELKALIRETVREVVREELGRTKPPEIIKRYCDILEIATYFNVSRDTVRKWATEDGCPHSVHGKLWRFELEAVEAWFRSEGTPQRLRPRRANGVRSRDIRRAVSNG